MMQPLIDRLGPGKFFTILGCVSGSLGAGLIWGSRKYGSECRGKRVDREAEQKAAGLPTTVQATKS